MFNKQSDSTTQISERLLKHKATKVNSYSSILVTPPVYESYIFMQLSKIQSIYWTNLSHRIHSLAKLCSLWLFGCLGYLSLKLFIKVRRWLIFGRLYPLLLFCLWTGGEGLPRSSHNMEDTAGSLAVTHFIGVHNSPHTHTRTYASLLAHARTHRYTCTHTHRYNNGT